MEMRKKLHYMLEIDILKNSSLKKNGTPEEWFFKGLVGVQKDIQTLLLAKTMC